MRPNTNYTAKRLDIIKVALDLFLEKGYEKTKISHIMTASHLSKGGMYHYFESKEAILDGVIHYAISEELSDFTHLLQQKTTVFEKMALFLDNGMVNYSDYMKKFTQFKRHPESSIVTYRIKDLTAQVGILHLTTIIIFGIQEKNFQTDYPEELAPILYHAGEQLFSAVMSLKSSSETGLNILISHKVNAFLELLQRSLAMNSQDREAFKDIIWQALLPENKPN